VRHVVEGRVEAAGEQAHIPTGNHGIEQHAA
jgi:hypothetical protein